MSESLVGRRKEYTRGAKVAGKVDAVGRADAEVEVIVAAEKEVVNANAAPAGAGEAAKVAVIVGAVGRATEDADTDVGVETIVAAEKEVVDASAAPEGGKAVAQGEHDVAFDADERVTGDEDTYVKVELKVGAEDEVEVALMRAKTSSKASIRIFTETKTESERAEAPEGAGEVAVQVVHEVVSRVGVGDHVAGRR